MDCKGIEKRLTIFRILPQVPKFHKIAITRIEETKKMLRSLNHQSLKVFRDFQNIEVTASSPPRMCNKIVEIRSLIAMQNDEASKVAIRKKSFVIFFLIAFKTGNTVLRSASPPHLPKKKSTTQQTRQDNKIQTSVLVTPITTPGTAPPVPHGVQGTGQFAFLERVTNECISSPPEVELKDTGVRVVAVCVSPSHVCIREHILAALHFLRCCIVGIAKVPQKISYGEFRSYSQTRVVGDTLCKAMNNEVQSTASELEPMTEEQRSKKRCQDKLYQKCVFIYGYQI